MQETALLLLKDLSLSSPSTPINRYQELVKENRVHQNEILFFAQTPQKDR